MAEYVCKVGDAAGRIFEEIEDAGSETEARQKLADRGLYVLSVRIHLSLSSALGKSRRERALRSGDFLLFNQQFNTLVKAGLPILKALDLITERTAAPRLRPYLNEVRQKVRDGAMLSDAFDSVGIFPKVYTTALLAGEKSGNLAGVLDDYISYQSVTTGVRKKIIGVLIYPTILVVVASLILSYLFTAVIPQFAKLYSDLGVALPGPTRFLTTVVVGYRYDVLAGLLALVLLIVFSFVWARTDRGGMVMDKLKLKLPVIGDVWIKFQIAQFARTLSTLVAGGTPLVGALQTAAEAIRSRLVAAGVGKASARVREGESLHSGLASAGFVPPLALEMIEVGEASGALGAMLTSVAQFYEEETNSKMSALISVIEPAILIFMAIIVAFILISLYLPLFSLNFGG
jgi:type IV pilus assembly protein PilC